MRKNELVASSNNTTNATCIERNLAEKDARLDKIRNKMIRMQKYSNIKSASEKIITSIINQNIATYGR